MNNQESAILIDCIENLSQNDSFVNMRKYIQHGKTDCLLHSIAVAYYSYAAAKCLHLKLNEKSLVTGALLHDFFLYDWHKPDISHRFHGFTHPETALKNARRNWKLNETEIDIITKHMFPLFPPCRIARKAFSFVSLIKSVLSQKYFPCPPVKKSDIYMTVR